ncbi:MAG TPA: DNA gyrase subunit A, partial [Candidatus Vogelbacteria bacterium]|nr:DNA gyrase subunit A [Candidatus Vogelbacteria bacterium]
LALVDGVPKLLNLKGLLEEFIKHRQEVIVRRTKYDLKQAEDREHILLGLTKALDHIDEIIKTIKKSSDTKDAHGKLMKQFKFSDRQATAILEMKLQKLAGLERKKIEDELKEKQRLIKEYKAILVDSKKVIKIMKDEFIEIKEKYGDDRKTKVIKSAIKEINPEDLIPEKEDVLVITSGGYIKRTDPKEYRSQKRGGKGVIDLNVKEEDFVSIFLTASTHDDLLFFSDRGKVYQTKMYDIPDSRRVSRGKSIMNFLSLEAEERITSVCPRSKEDKTDDSFIFMITKKGVAKKVESKNFKDVRRSGLLAIKLAKGDDLFSVLKVKEGDNIILATKEGQSICFNQKDLRPMGRQAAGVRALRLKKGDEVVGASSFPPSTDGRFLVLSEKGYGKMTELSEYRAQKRGGSGVKTAKVTDKTGKLVIARIITDEEEIIAISRQGQVIRTKISELPILGRQTQGVRIMRMKDKDAVATFTCL